MLEEPPLSLEAGQVYCVTHGIQFLVDPETARRVEVEWWGRTAVAGTREWEEMVQSAPDFNRIAPPRAKGDGLCEECVRELRSGEFVDCPGHGIQPVSDDGRCAQCALAPALAEGGAGVDEALDDLGGAVPPDAVVEGHRPQPDAVAQPAAARGGADGDGAGGAGIRVLVPARDGGGNPLAGRGFAPASAEAAVPSEGRSADHPSAGMRAMLGAWAQRGVVPQGNERGDGAACSEGAAEPAPETAA